MAFFLCFLPSSLFAKDNANASAAQILLVPIGSRALGMGSAFTAVASDASALYYNPAGLSRLPAHELSGSFSAGLADNSMSYFAYGGPMPFTGITGGGYASLGASLLYAPAGTVEIFRTNPDGSLLSSETKHAGWDLVASLGYAERIGVMPFDLGEGSVLMDNFLGVTGKIIHSNLVQDFSDTSYAADVGYLAAIPEWGVSAGVSASNLGSYMKFVDKGDPLPTSLRFGAAYQWRRLSRHNLTLAADGDYLLYDKLWHAYTGVEYSWFKAVAFRAGYQFNQDNLLGLTLGFGFKIQNNFIVDYAWAAATGAGLTDTHRFTLAYRFGGLVAGSRARQRQPSIEDLPDNQDSPAPNTQAPSDARGQPGSEAGEQKGASLPGWIY